MKDLSVIIVNYNTRALLRDCITAIFNDLGSLRAEVIVVDNCSTDGSVEMIHNDFSSIKLISNADNAGFARANNQAASLSDAELMLFLNSDTQVNVGCLEQSVAFMRACNSIGVMTCKVLNSDMTIQDTCFNDPNLFSELAYFTKVIIKDIWDPFTWYKYMKYTNYSTTRLVNCVSGCFLLVRAKIFRDIGGFDESFFMYQEDADFCRRVREKSHFKVAYFPSVSIIHHQRKSTPENMSLRIITYSYHSTIHYFQKYYNSGYANLFRILCRIVWRIERSILVLFKMNKKAYDKYLMIKKLASIEPIE